MLLQTGVSITASVLCCTAYYLAKAPTQLSLRFALSVTLLFAATLTVCRTFLLEKKHQVEILLHKHCTCSCSAQHPPCVTHAHHPIYMIKQPVLGLSCLHSCCQHAKLTLCQHTLTEADGFSLLLMVSYIVNFAGSFAGRAGTQRP